MWLLAVDLTMQSYPWKCAWKLEPAAFDCNLRHSWHELISFSCMVVAMLFQNHLEVELYFFGYFPQMQCPDIRERKLLSESLHIFTKRFLPSDPCHSIIGHFSFSSVKNWSKTLKFTTEQHNISGKMYLMHSTWYGLFFYFQHI